MKKAVVLGVLLISLVGLNGHFHLLFNEELVHADVKTLVVDDAITLQSPTGNQIATSGTSHKLCFKIKDAGKQDADITIIKADGSRTDIDQRPIAVGQYFTYVGPELVTGDRIKITANVELNNYGKGSVDKINVGETILLEVDQQGKLVKLSTGAGQAQVTYNVNTANPDDPTANPDFTVLIPTEYQLSNKQKVSVGAVALKDAKDVTQNYTGDKAVKVAVTSAKNFQFDNGGTYKLVGGNKADIPAEITLDKTSTSSEVNAQLTKEGSKTAAADMLTFNYTVAP